MKYLLKNVCNGLIFLVLVIGIVGGLSAAVTIPCFLIVILMLLRNQIQETFLALSYKNYKIEILFALWCLLSCVWSINIVSNLLTYCQVFLALFTGLIINNCINKSTKSLYDNDINRWLIIGVVTAIGLFFVEYFTHGLLSHDFRVIFQSSSKQVFYLYMLDRGCALLSVTSWVVIGIMISRAQYLQTVLLCALILIMLFISDSLASFLGFILGGATFIMSRVIKGFFWLISIAMLSGSILMPIFAYNIQPAKMSDQYATYLPLSAKHRLFIWHFVAHKIMDNPLHGIGFASSRQVRLTDDQWIDIDHAEQKVSPLPLHPHNNVLQITLETGVIGLILFLILIYKNLHKIRDAGGGRIYQSVAYACLVNYYTIGMISYSMWQLWWVYSAIWVSVLMSLTVSMGNSTTSKQIT